MCTIELRNTAATDRRSLFYDAANVTDFTGIIQLYIGALDILNPYIYIRYKIIFVVTYDCGESCKTRTIHILTRFAGDIFPLDANHVVVL